MCSCSLLAGHHIPVFYTVGNGNRETREAIRGKNSSELRYSKNLLIISRSPDISNRRLRVINILALEGAKLASQESTNN